MNITTAVQKNINTVFEAIQKDEIRLVTSWFNNDRKIVVKNSKTLKGSVSLDVFLTPAKEFSFNFMYSEESNFCYEKRISFYKFFESFTNPCSESLIKRTVRKVIGCIRRFFYFKKTAPKKGF